MRPLLHPPIEGVTVEGILHALSDPVRAAIYTQLVHSEGSRNCSNFSEMSDRTIPKSTLSQHFKVLRDAGLIRSERKGVEMQNIGRCAEIENRFPGLVASIMRAYSIQMAQSDLIVE